MVPMQGKAPDWDRVEQALLSIVHRGCSASRLEPKEELLALRSCLRAFDKIMAEQFGHALSMAEQFDHALSMELEPETAAVEKGEVSP